MIAGLRCAIAAAGLAAFAGMASAQGAGVSLGVAEYDSSAPIEITSDELRVNQEDGTAIFAGNVIIGQGDLRLTAASVQVNYAVGENEGETEVKTLQASGGVTIVTGAEAAEADQAVYDVASGKIKMTGNVLLTQGPSAISADTLVFDLESGEGVMRGRVKTVLQAGNQ